MIVVPEHLPILFVDDDEADRTILEIVLKKSNIKNEAVFLEDGQAAIDYLSSALEGQHAIPGLALLDINMPGLTGFDVLSFIRSRDELQELPVAVMLTSSDSDRDKKRATELRASAYLPKQSGLVEFTNLFDRNFSNETGY